MRAVLSILVAISFSLSTAHAQAPLKSGEQLFNELIQNLDMNASLSSIGEKLAKLAPAEQIAIKTYATQLRDTNPSLVTRSIQTIEQGEQITVSEAMAATSDGQKYACIDACLTLIVFTLIAVFIISALPSADYSIPGHPVF